MSPKQFIIVIIQFYDYVYLTAIRKKDTFFVIACVLCCKEMHEYWYVLQIK